MDITNAVICLSGILISMSNLALVFYLTRWREAARQSIPSRSVAPKANAERAKLKPRAKTDEELHHEELEEIRRSPRF